jgi:hypothetical protein
MTVSTLAVSGHPTRTWQHPHSGSADTSLSESGTLACNWRAHGTYTAAGSVFDRDARRESSSRSPIRAVSPATRTQRRVVGRSREPELADGRQLGTIGAFTRPRCLGSSSPRRRRRRSLGPRRPNVVVRRHAHRSRMTDIEASDDRRAMRRVWMRSSRHAPSRWRVCDSGSAAR